MSEIIEYQPNQSSIMSVQEAQSRRTALSQFVRNEVLRSGIDYGVIPGTGKKPVLLKPGAEKLATFFHLTPRFEVVDKIINFESGLFYFQYCCTLSTRDGMVVGQGIGSCNSNESKYRYRRAKQVCPSCGAEDISRSKYPPRNNPNAAPGWWCRSCKSDYAVDDPAIIDQPIGKIENPDRADVLNTVDKMAQKRAFVEAVLRAVNASEFFTQDMEDFTEYAEVESPTPKSAGSYRGGADEPPPPDIPVAPATSNKKPTHWIEDAEARRRFWARYSVLGRGRVHEELGVESVKDFGGTMRKAATILDAALDALEQESEAVSPVIAAVCEALAVDPDTAVDMLAQAEEDGVRVDGEPVEVAAALKAYQNSAQEALEESTLDKAFPRDAGGNPTMFDEAEPPPPDYTSAIAR